MSQELTARVGVPTPCTLIRNLMVLAASALLAACASAPRIYSTTNPEADFATYQTFAFTRELGTDRSDGQRTILSQRLMAAARREMEALGYRYSESDPDLLVNFYLHTKEKVSSTTTPSMSVGMGYYGYRGSMYGTWGGYDTTVTQYTEGTLNVDLVDPARRELVWEGVAVGRLTEKVRENLDTSVRTVMHDVFARHPLAPAS